MTYIAKPVKMNIYVKLNLHMLVSYLLELSYISELAKCFTKRESTTGRAVYKWEHKYTMGSEHQWFL